MCRIFSVVLNTRLELSLRQHYQFCSNKDNSSSFVTKQRKKKQNHFETQLCNSATSLISFVLRQDNLGFPHSGYCLLSSKGQGVLRTNRYCISAKTGKNKVELEEENVGIVLRCYKGWEQNHDLLFLLSAVAVCVFFLCLCFDFSCSLLFLLLLPCSFIVCCPGLFCCPRFAVIFKLKGVLLESNRNTAQLCCCME